MNQNLKKGDVITVEKEIKSKVKNNEDVSLIVVGSENEDSMSNVLELLDSSIFQIVENDMHPEIGNFGVDIKKYSIKATNVESVAKVPENKDMIRINGEVDIDTTGKGHKTLLDSHFFDGEYAKQLCTALNEAQLEKIDELQDLLSKAKEMMEDVVKRQLY